MALVCPQVWNTLGTPSETLALPLRRDDILSNISSVMVTLPAGIVGSATLMARVDLNPPRKTNAQL